MVRAVVFDLWQTLAAWPDEKSVELRRTWSTTLEIPAERLDELWSGGDLHHLRETGPIAPAIEALYELLGVEGDVEEVLAYRLGLTRDALVPVAGAISTLEQLRELGVATGLISNCTEEVALVWDESPFAGLFDSTVFSATVGRMKPDPRIYELALHELGVSPSEALFVGDGANDELAGAERVGMTPVLVHPQGEEPPWEGLRGWTGLRVTAVRQILDLVT